MRIHSFALSPTSTLGRLWSVTIQNWPGNTNVLWAARVPPPGKSQKWHSGITRFQTSAQPPHPGLQLQITLPLITVWRNPTAGSAHAVGQVAQSLATPVGTVRKRIWPAILPLILYCNLFYHSLLILKVRCSIWLMTIWLQENPCVCRSQYEDRDLQVSKDSATSWGSPCYGPEHQRVLVWHQERFWQLHNILSHLPEEFLVLTFPIAVFASINFIFSESIKTNVGNFS